MEWFKEKNAGPPDPPIFHEKIDGVRLKFSNQSIDEIQVK